MKTTILALILFLSSLDLWAQTPPAPNISPILPRFQSHMRGNTNNPVNTRRFPGLPAPGMNANRPAGQTRASTTLPTPMASTPPSAVPTAQDNGGAGYDYDWSGVDVNQVLDVYADLVGRTLIRGSLPSASIVLKTETPLTKAEAIEALQAVLAINGISIVDIGDKFAKVVPSTDAGSAGGAFNTTPTGEIPDMGTYVTRIVQLNYLKPSLVVPIITPLAKLNSIIPLDDNGILVIRDYAENVKRMLEMIRQVDVSVPEEYISEVIPIKYALADDIASALNSLGGSGTATVSFGSSSAPSTVSGVRSGGAAGGALSGASGNTGSTLQNNGINQSRTGLGTQGTTTPNGTPSTGTTFQQRLQSIISRAATPGGGSGGGQQPIQVFGQAKIIADERSNSLLIFATRQDMDAITNVIAKLDVLLSQVLIEAVIIDYDLGPNTVNYGVSASQGPQTYSPSQSIVGGGGVNNGQSLLNLLSGFTSASNNISGFASALPGGLSYFGNIGPNWNVALEAAASDSHSSVIQRPRIQTSQAKPAQFFVGETVPYVTSTYNYGGAYGNQSSYSQLSVGVELDVTPFINPDGLVVMDIQQEIDDIDGYTTITGVGNIPNTDKRTLSSEIAVRNGDTVMLGGFIKNEKDTSRSGVPLLEDIPLLGKLFSQSNDSKQREELIVLMRPTVLKTPEIAAENTIREEQRLPGDSAAAAQETADQEKIVEGERKTELKHPKTMSGGFYNATWQTNEPQSQLSQPEPR